jgi:hypothetical protein
VPPHAPSASAHAQQGRQGAGASGSNPLVGFPINLRVAASSVSAREASWQIFDRSPFVLAPQTAPVGRVVWLSHSNDVG